MGVYRRKDSKILYNALRVDYWNGERNQWMVDAIAAGLAYFEPYESSKYRLVVVESTGKSYAYVGDWVAQNPVTKRLTIFQGNSFWYLFEKVEDPGKTDEREEAICPNQLRIFLNSLPKESDIKVTIGEYNVISLIAHGSMEIDRLIAENDKLKHQAKSEHENYIDEWTWVENVGKMLNEKTGGIVLDEKSTGNTWIRFDSSILGGLLARRKELGHNVN